MINNNNHNSSCAFNEQLVSYLYGEYDGAEKVKFETHLKDCSNCADELASLGFVRSSISDWKAAEFSSLATPDFDISFIEAAETDSSRTHNWFDEFKKIFTFNPQLAAAAFAGLIVCVGIALFALNFSGNRSEVAQNIDNTNSTKTSVSPIVEIKPKSEEAKVTTTKEEKTSAITKTADLPKTTAAREQPSATTDKTVVKVSSDAPKNNSETPVRSPKMANNEVKKPSPVQKRKVPNLNNLEEDEDETIRLADLFAELDTK